MPFSFPLYTACYRGDLETLRRITTLEPLHRSQHHTLSRLAIKYDYLSIFNWLLEWPDLTPVMCNRYLRIASVWGNENILHILLKRNDIDIHTNRDLPLRITSKRGHYSMVKTLLECGADPSSCSHYALRQACLHKHLKIAQLLVQYGSPIDKALSFSDIERLIGSNQVYMISWILTLPVMSSYLYHPWTPLWIKLLCRKIRSRQAQKRWMFLFRMVQIILAARRFRHRYYQPQQRGFYRAWLRYISADLRLNPCHTEEPNTT